MKLKLSQFGLGISAEIITPEALNFRPTSWPPKSDFPIVLDAANNVVSRYGDCIWYLWPWSQKPIQLNFGDGPQRKGSRKISSENAQILRQIVAWWIYGHRSVRQASTLLSQLTQIKPIFVVCSEAGILVTDLHKFPSMVEKIANECAVSESLPYHLHALYEWRDTLGFVILPPESIKKIAGQAAPRTQFQTAYIPPRIWTYQVLRLKELFDDFELNRSQFEKCYKFYLDLYSTCDLPPRVGRTDISHLEINSGPDKHGSSTSTLKPFKDMANEFGLSAFLEKWVPTTYDNGPAPLTSVLTLIGYAGIAYILNFTMMRIEEAWNLQIGCFSKESDKNFGDIFTVTGRTTKTTQDDDARWITSPSVSQAIRCMEAASKLRLIASATNTNLTTMSIEQSRWLVLSACEPWSRSGRLAKLGIRPDYQSYLSIIENYPLFDLQKLTITEEDLVTARRVNEAFDHEKFAVGKPWPLAWHQLRRTGVVNMLSSSIVSDASVQYQLKHSSRAMSLYYGKGYSGARLNEASRREYISTLYEIIAKDIKELSTNRYISPYGTKRKDQILAKSNFLTVKELEMAVKKGEIGWRPTIFGGCSKIGPCPYGGYDHVAKCGGGLEQSPCADLIIDKEKHSKIEVLKNDIFKSIDNCHPNSPRRSGLILQMEAVNNVLNLIAVG